MQIADAVFLSAEADAEADTEADADGRCRGLDLAISQKSLKGSQTTTASRHTQARVRGVLPRGQTRIRVHWKAPPSGMAVQSKRTRGPIPDWVRAEVPSEPTSDESPISPELTSVRARREGALRGLQQ